MRSYSGPNCIVALLAIATMACCSLSQIASADEAATQPTGNPAATANANTASPASDATDAASRRLRFQFTYAPWKDVLDWLAREADLSLVIDTAPPGEFNYTDDRQYSPTQAIDVLNSVLLTKGFVLVRHGRMLMLVDLKNGIPANLVATVPAESLDRRGEFELVNVLFDVKRIEPEEAQEEIRQLLGPQGSVAVLKKSRQLSVTDTAGRLREIRAVLQRIGDSDGVRVAVIRLRKIDPQIAVQLINKLFTSGDAAKGTATGPQVDVDPAGRQLTVRGTESEIAQIQDLLDKLGERPTSRTEVAQDRRMRTLSANSVAAAAALARMQEIWPSLRTNKIQIVTPPAGSWDARPDRGKGADDRWQNNDSGRNDGRRDSLQRPRRSRPSDAPVEKEKTPKVKPAESGPTTLDAPEAAPRSEHSAGMSDGLWGGARVIFASEQIETIEPMDDDMDDMDELDDLDEPAAPPIVVVPGPNGLIITSEDTEALDQFERMLNVLITPPKSSTSERGVFIYYLKYAKATTAVESLAQILGTGATVSGINPTGGAPATATTGGAAPSPRRGGDPAANDRAASGSEGGPAEDRPSGDRPFGRRPFGGRTRDGEPSGEPPFSGGPPRDFSPPGGFGPPGGLGLPGGLEALNSGPTESDGSSAGGAVAVVARLDAGRSGLVSGPVQFTADQRLNALLIQANRSDLGNIEKVLKILDQKESPEEISVVSKPRMIPIKHTKAQDVADVVKQIYADRMTQSGGATAQPIPPWMMGGRAGRQLAQTLSNQARQKEDTATVSIGVDARTNSLVVASTDALFEEIRQLVAQLDVAAENQSDAVRIVTLQRTSPAAVEQALLALAGESVQVNHANVGTPNGAMPAGRGPASPYSSRRMQSGASGQAPGARSGGDQPYQGRNRSNWRDRNPGQVPP